MNGPQKFYRNTLEIKLASGRTIFVCWKSKFNRLCLDILSVKKSQTDHRFKQRFKYGSHIFRSINQTCSVRKGVPRNFAEFAGKYLCQSPFFNKVAGLRPVTLLKKRLWHRCFPANFVKFRRTPFLQNTSGRLLLYLQYHRFHIEESIDSQ